MKDLYLLNYNNYINRITKRENSLDDYLPYLANDVISNINFDPHDGITTKIVINASYINEDTEPDYLIVLDVGDSDIANASLWFVMNTIRNRANQYVLSLRRDVVAENLSLILKEDSYIYKGTLKDSDPMIFNDEGMSFNQIKTSETLLKDYTGMPWIVAYLDPGVAKEDIHVTNTVEGYFDLEYDNLNEYPYYNYFNKHVYDPAYMSVKMPVENISYMSSNDRWANIILYPNGAVSLIDSQPRIETSAYQYGNQITSAYQNAQTKWSNTAYSTRLDAISNEDAFETSIINQLKTQDGKIIKVGTNYYQVSVKYKVKTFSQNIGSTQDQLIQNLTVNDSNNQQILSTYLTEKQYTNQAWGANQITISGSGYEVTYNSISVSDTVLTGFVFKVKDVDLSNSETPFAIIAMPYEDGVNMVSSIGEQESGLTKENRLKTLQSLGSAEGLVYDIQLVPYCPVRNLVVDNNKTIYLNNSSSPVRSFSIYSETKSGDEYVQGAYVTSCIIASEASFSFNIPNAITITNLKQQNSTDMWRLCSPNYAGSFEFNAAKFFDGSSYTTIEGFNVDCTYRPYSPYIHVAPEFSGLYGQDFGDTRGLICGGDFSLDRISDSWATYQLNNKNWQLSFDRQIQSMELQYKWNIASSVVGGVGNMISAGFMGGIAGNGVGAGLGVASGAADLAFNIAEAISLGRDNIDAAKDQFGYNIANIKALPNGLTKVSALNSNNKLFPFVEYYTCTDKEKESFNKKMIYEGMTVMRVDQIKNFVYDGEENFVRARVIRATDISEDFKHLVEINNELMMGVYIHAN